MTARCSGVNWNESAVVNSSSSLVSGPGSLVIVAVIGSLPNIVIAGPAAAASACTAAASETYTSYNALNIVNM